MTPASTPPAPPPTPRAATPDLLHLRRGFLSDRALSDADVEQAMIGEFERVLRDPIRVRHPAGAILLQEGEDLDHIYIRLAGEVSLLRHIDGRDIVFHTHTVGRIIGLMSLSDRNRALYTCKAETPVEVIKVTLAELDEALQSSPVLSIHFTTVLLRSLATRNRRAAELRLEVQELNRALSRERDQLEDTLSRLKKAHLRLVESEKMATLGQLTAGLAHELNNPVAAISRAADFLERDVRALGATTAAGPLLQRFLSKARETAPLSTRDERTRRTALAAELGDEALATRLVHIGIESLSEAQDVLGSPRGGDFLQALGRVEGYHQIGSSLRNIHTCADRIAGLVSTLRSYSRVGSTMEPGVDLRQGLEETVRLFGHALRGVDVQREYQDVPPITGTASELNQVWTNLIDNAIQAMEGKGSLRLEIASPSAAQVAVSIIDNGPGIPPENLDRIFHLNFTTKQGRVDYGIGLGLAICRQIVDRHGGNIHVESRPGRTAFTVCLPIAHEQAAAL